MTRTCRTRVALVAGALTLTGFGAAAPSAMARNVLEYEGRVVSLAHSAQGKASVVKVGDGRRFLTLTSFSVRPGPRVLVYLVAGKVRGDGDVRDFRSLGGLKGSKGNQQYLIPKGVNVSRYKTVVLWCVPFTQALAKADLKRR